MLKTMPVVTNSAEINDNIRRFQGYLSQPGVDRDFALGLLERGICFVVATQSNAVIFAPSRFVGYTNNNRHVHEQNDTKDGRITNEAIEQILRVAPVPNASIEHEYHAFCTAIGAKARTAPFNVTRKFWDIR